MDDSRPSEHFKHLIHFTPSKQLNFKNNFDNLYHYQYLIKTF
ncbi:hypothetical protein NEIFLAOT_01545 [Neisseria flavescens NRL30031/H210]|uniref:Uncharacterized protein n=1 Tax=Neisseria flavescens NRL30031/H210 TaxID=546264 RepID=C0ENL0_NEIFL|nr:hypothetical protein NEIFLAOT_01545 [Neisseria flavescens NRL30031/H210]